MNQNPKVTICFLTYNYAPHMERALLPLINQTYNNTQVIISNNQSTDNTEQIAKEIIKKYPRVIYRYNIPDLKKEDFSDIAEKNVPADKKSYDVVFNHCNSIINSGQIEGEFVIFCHQDDIYEVDIVEKQVAFLVNNPKAMGVFTMGNLIDKNNNRIGSNWLPGELRGKNLYHFEEIFKAVMRHGNRFLLAPTFMARKEVFQNVGLFDDQGPFGGSDDLEMWFRILEKHPMGILENQLINRRIGGRAKQYNKLRTNKADFFKVMDYYLDQKGYRTSMDTKSLRQYALQNDADYTLRAMNFVIKNEPDKARPLLGNFFSLQLWLALLENPKLQRFQVFCLKHVLALALALKLHKPLGNFLAKKLRIV